MKTRTFILSGENLKGANRAILSIKGDNTLFCDLRSYGESSNLVKVVLKAGEIEYYADAVDLNMDYHFIVEGANIDDEMKIAVFDGDGSMSNNLSPEVINEMKAITMPKKDLENQKVEKQSQNEDNSNDESLSEGEDMTFFDAISPQFDETFGSGDHCVEIETLIPNSSWVWVNGEGEFKYVLGKIFENKELKYICYAEESECVDEIPNSVDPQYAQWLPVEPGNEKSKGFYVMYQDAKSGETIKMD